jgi:hypothetical protein
MLKKNGDRYVALRAVKRYSSDKSKNKPDNNSKKSMYFKNVNMFLSSIIKFDMIHLQPMQYKNKKLQN